MKRKEKIWRKRREMERMSCCDCDGRKRKKNRKGCNGCSENVFFLSPLSSFTFWIETLPSWTGFQTDRLGGETQLASTQFDSVVKHNLLLWFRVWMDAKRTQRRTITNHPTSSFPPLLSFSVFIPLFLFRYSFLFFSPTPHSHFSGFYFSQFLFRSL